MTDRARTFTKFHFTLIAIVLCALIGVSQYNGLVHQQEAVKLHWGQVETQYERRLALIPNLVNTVKGYAKHERETFLAVTQARQHASDAQRALGSTHNSKTIKAFSDAQQQLTAAMGKLMVVVERYPTLKANENFLMLQNQLEGTENRIAVERKRYNDAVGIFNAHIRQFPTNLIARYMGTFEPEHYFKAQATAATVPVVNFS